MGNRFDKPNRKSTKQDGIIVISEQNTSSRQDGILLRNRSTQMYGIANDLPKDDIDSTKTSRILKLGTRHKRPSKIPVAAWRSSIAPEPNPMIADKPKTNDCEKKYKKLGDGNNGSDREGDVSSCKEQDSRSSDTRVRKGISYTILIGEYVRKTSPRKPKTTDQDQTNKKSVYNKVDRLRTAEMNRKNYLENRVQKARLYDKRRQDNSQRRQAVSAEQRQKFLAKQKHREKAAIREEIHKRLDTFKNNIKKVRLLRPDRENE